jgi:hypothetical protein
MIVSNLGTPISAVRKLPIFRIQQKSSCMGEDLFMFFGKTWCVSSCYLDLVSPTLVEVPSQLILSSFKAWEPRVLPRSKG